MNSDPTAEADPQPDPQPDWAQLLPREVFLEIIFVLRGALPPPARDRTPAQARRELARRDREAMAAVAALMPLTAAEGRLAAQYVAADAWAMDCLRLAGLHQHEEPERARKCRAQSASLMREARSALRWLERLQAKREKTEQDAGLANRATWTEHCALGMMKDGLVDEVEEPEAADAFPDGDGATAAAAEDVWKLGLGAGDGMVARGTGFETERRFAASGGWTG